MKPTEMYVTRWSKIAAITPYYRATGRTGTQIHYADGHTERYNNRCEWVVEQLAKHFHTNTELARTQSSGLFEGRVPRKLPLALQKNFCLVPLKFRDVPEGKKFSTLCYVVLQYVDKLEHAPDGNCIIRFHKNAKPLHILQRAKSVESQINLAWMVQDHYVDEQQRMQYEMQLVWQEIHSGDMVIEDEGEEEF